MGSYRGPFETACSVDAAAHRERGVKAATAGSKKIEGPSTGRGSCSEHPARFMDEGGPFAAVAIFGPLSRSLEVKDLLR
jgi:hypothetical protein